MTDDERVHAAAEARRMTVLQRELVSQRDGAMAEVARLRQDLADAEAEFGLAMAARDNWRAEADRLRQLYEAEAAEVVSLNDEVARLRAEIARMNSEVPTRSDNARLRAKLQRALDALGLTLDALSYMTAPTMARPSDRDPADFAMTDATEKDVRLALRTCIEMALACLNNIEATGVPVEGVRIRRAVLAAHDQEEK